MKKAAAVVVALAILIAGLPALLGVLAQDRIGELANEATGQFLEVSISGYQRGWRTSRASLTVALSEYCKAMLEAPFSMGPGTPDLPQELQDLLDLDLQLAADIVHGPLLTQGGVGLGLAHLVVRVDSATAGQEQLLAMLGTPGPGEVAARVGIGSISQFHWEIPPVTFSNVDGMLASSGQVGEGTYDMARQRLVWQTQMDHLELSGPRGALEIEDFTLSGDGTAITAGVWSGTSDVGLGGLSVTGPGNVPIATLDNLSFLSRNEINESGNLIDVKFEVNADSVEGTMDGDAHNISSVGLHVALRNLDMAASLEYQQAVFDTAGIGLAASDPAALFARLQPIIYDILLAEPEIESGPLSFNWNDGTLQARVVLRVDNEMLPAEPMFSFMDASLWTRLVSVEAELDVDRNIAEWIAGQAMANRIATPAVTDGEVPADILQAQARGTLVSLVTQGMLEETESGYRFRGSFENGVVEVNGQVVPIGPGAQGQF